MAVVIMEVVIMADTTVEVIVAAGTQAGISGVVSMAAGIV
jgi:hypothetical protein